MADSYSHTTFTDSPLLSKVSVPDGAGGSTSYYVKDAESRRKIDDLYGIVEGGVHFIGICTDAIEDGGTTNPVTITGVTGKVTPDAGDIIIVRKSSYTPAAKQDKEFIWSGTSSSGQWNLFGEINIDDFGDLAWTNLSQLQTDTEVVTASGAVTIDTTASGGTAILTAGSIPANVVTDTSVDVTGTIPANTISISQGTKTPTYKYAHDVSVVTDTSVDVTGTISAPSISQGTKTPTNAYGHNLTVATEGIVLSANGTTETLTFTAAGTGTATVINNTEASADTTLLSDVSFADPTMGDITIAAGTLTDTLTTGTASVINTTPEGGTALLSDVSFADPTASAITISSGTLTDTLTTTAASVTTGYLHQAADTKSKVDLEKKSS